MQKLKENWLNIFLVFMIIGAFILFSLITHTWKEEYAESRVKHEHMVRLISNSIDSVIRSNETILSILGDILLDSYTQGQPITTPMIFNKILKSNKSIAAIGLVSTEGEIIYISGGPIYSLPNLKEQEESRDSFQHALEHPEKTVVGRTYYFDYTNEWVIPVRKAIRNYSGEVVAVCTVALRLEDTINVFNNRLHEGKHNKVTVLRDFDLYRQYVSSSETDNETYYNEPFDKAVLENIGKGIDKKYGLEDIKESGEIVSVIIENKDREKTFISAQYNKRYELWVASEEPLKYIQWKIALQIIPYVVLYTIILIVVYIMISTIQRKDRKRNDDLYYFANHDTLTGLKNYKYLTDNIEKWYDKDNGFSMLYIDIDHFKGLNGTYGHNIGNGILLEVSKRLLSNINKSDLIIRKGGDEFLILLEEHDTEELFRKSDELIMALSRPYTINSIVIYLEASIGISRYPQHGKDISALILAADIAMHESKKMNTSAVIYSELYEQSFIARRKLEGRLEDAICRDEIYMVYQPQVGRNRELIGVEALVRWFDKDFGMVDPELLISIAESSGGIINLGRFIIQSSLQNIKYVIGETGRDIHLSVNISVNQFMNRNFTESLNKMLKDIGFSRERLTLEVTESLFIENRDYVCDILNSFKDENIRISLDDFGTGYSSLSMLKVLPMDELKIDKSFVDDILVNDNSRNMIRNIIDIGKNMGLTVVAEGVESEAQFELLKEFGCDCFQGYLFSKPLKSLELLSYISGN